MMVFVKWLFFIFIFTFSCSSIYAEEPQKQEEDLQIKAEEKRQKILSNLEKLKTLEAAKVPDVLPGMRSDLMDYLSINNKICRGEFSVVIFGRDPLPTDPEKSIKPKRLDWKERKACLQALDGFRNKFFEAQKVALLKYFDHIHEVQRKKFLETYESFKK